MAYSIVPFFPSQSIEHPPVFGNTQLIEPLRHLVPVPEEFGCTLAVHDMPGSIVPTIGIEIIQIVPADALFHPGGVDDLLSVPIALVQVEPSYLGKVDCAGGDAAVAFRHPVTGVVETHTGIILHAERFPYLLLHILRVTAPHSPLDDQAENLRIHTAVIMLLPWPRTESQTLNNGHGVGSVIQTGHAAERVD